MNIEKIYDKIKRAYHYGPKYIFWKMSEKMGLTSSTKSEYCVEEYYRKLTPKQREKELRVRYREKMGHSLNLCNPETFNEKLQWLKLYDSTPAKTCLTDKVVVRDWIKEKIGEEYLIPLIGVWNSFDEIDFDSLPDEYALQCNHGCKMIVIVRKDQPLNKEAARKKFDNWLNTNYGLNSRFELHYRDISPKIIATKYMENIAGDLFDYKFYCFDGVVKFIQVIKGRYGDERISFYDRGWNMQNFYYTYGHMRGDKDYCEKPSQLERAIQLAEQLSKGFAYVRVDLYLLGDDQIYFGEMTFTPVAGEINWMPKNTDKMLGSLLTLPSEKYILA